MAAAANEMQNQIEQMNAVIQRSRVDPVWWTNNILGSDLWPKQRQIMEAVRDTPEVAVKSCHAIGKSFTAARIALWFGACHYPSIVVTTAPTARQVRRILWKEIGSAYRSSRMPLGGKILTQELSFAPDWFILGFTAADYDPDRFQGFHAPYILVIIDEASGVSSDIYEAIDSILASGHSRKLEIGNPTDPTSTFAKSFKATGVAKFTISAFDTPNFTKFGITLDDIRDGAWEKKITGPLPYPYLISPAWVRSKYERWGPDSPMFLARILAQFPDTAEDSLLKMSWIEAAANRELQPSGRIELGVDVARSGSNETIIMRRQGPVFRVHEAFQNRSLMYTVGRVVKAVKELGAAVVKIDDTGLGGGVTDRLRELIGEDLELANLIVVPIITSARFAESDYFFNKRMKFYWHVREMFESGNIDIDPEDQELFAQLSNLEYETRSGGALIMKSKKIAAKDKSSMSTGSDSPDRADALMLAAAMEEVATWTEDEIYLVRSNAATEFGI